eukprot:TRINITY_DN16026_c0_g1_i1.p1 TRINITY_DN16026_c0_g1~~TRINITY_DN16026_c0_g1_i1.p1  ORF type:complete len:614 (-),score=74.81 TRINITY_DN16026_c0_g1_i1:104-1735(-)
MDARLRARLPDDRSSFLTVRQGEAVAILQELHKERPVMRLLSHEETGHGDSYARDRRVSAWCRSNHVEWLQFPQSTVVRGLSLSDPWEPIWQASLDSFMAVEPKQDPFGALASVASQKLHSLESVGILTPTQLGLDATRAADRPYRQQGGESKALELLRTFLSTRGEHYSGSISSPNTAWTACSRLSPYIAWGHISIRTLFRSVEEKKQVAKGKWSRSLNAFLTRLYWRGHYCQRFEMRCWMEHRSLCEAWEHLRRGNTFEFGDLSLLGENTEQERIAAFKAGRTGYPMVDACMRCLLQTGWLNFRMRCMLVSFATFNLWLDWRAIAAHMAHCFLDFEPGIHYCQLQMQAGTTGRDLRCYSITRQAKDQDPKGEFIRRYVPELANVRNEFIHEPWKKANASANSDSTYPSRIVDEVKTSKAAKSAVSALQKWVQTAGEDRHGRTPPPLADLIEAKLSAKDEKKRSAEALGTQSSDIKRLLTARAEHGEEAQSITPDSAASSNPWTCPACTLINSPGSLCCEACENPREISKLVKADAGVIDLD